MRHDDEDFSRKSATYKAEYVKATAGLYGDMPYVPSKSRKVKRKPRDPSAPTEWQCQRTLVTWARLRGLPLISIPNQGKRSYWQAQREVAAGLTKGVSDTFLAMPSSGKHGYWLELKSKGKKPRPEQLEWMDKMRANGYAADWFDTWEAARDAIIKYLGE
jgi:hypothetical protein